MSYSIYVGTPKDIENSQEICSFSRDQHNETFRVVNSVKHTYGWLSELQQYEEFVNFAPVEIKALILEIEELLKNEALNNNGFLNCLLQAGKEALLNDLELMCSGED